jgi:hypothetical protein
MPRIPRVAKLDLRVEAVYTDTPAADPSGRGGEYAYWEVFYHDLYTNKGVPIGDWIGREGQGLQAWSTYWLSTRTSVQAEYRHAKVAGFFVAGGGTINDGSLRANFQVRPEWGVSTSVQYEQWNFPLLAAEARRNVTASVQLTYWPCKEWK